MIFEFLNFFSTIPEGHAVSNVVGLIATCSCLLFTGAFVYVSVVEHPARLDGGADVGTREWELCHRRANMLQTSLAGVSIVTGCARWMFGHHTIWLLGPALLALVVAYSYLIVVPTNKELLARSGESSEGAHELLLRWGHLNAVRTVVSLAASLVYLDALTRR